jgi:hypothetical protein
MKRILIGGIVAVIALSVVAYAFASGDDNTTSDNGDDLAQTEPTPADSIIVDLPTGTPTDAPATGGGSNGAGGTRPAGSNEPFGPAGEPVQKPDEPVSNQAPGTPPDATVAPGLPIPTPTPTGPAPLLPPDRHPEPAPIDGLDISIAESFPPQYFLHIEAGLPSGCAEKYAHFVSRAGDVITVSVQNSLPKDAICTAIYGMYELNLNLGSDFVSGKTYTVNVNDKTITFTAQ